MLRCMHELFVCLAGGLYLHLCIIVYSVCLQKCKFVCVHAYKFVFVCVFLFLFSFHRFYMLVCLSLNLETEFYPGFQIWVPLPSPPPLQKKTQTNKQNNTAHRVSKPLQNTIVHLSKCSGHLLDESASKHTHKPPVKTGFNV